MSPFYPQHNLPSSLDGREDQMGEWIQSSQAGARATVATQNRLWSGPWLTSVQQLLCPRHKYFIRILLPNLIQWMSEQKRRTGSYTSTFQSHRSQWAGFAGGLVTQSFSHRILQWEPGDWRRVQTPSFKKVCLLRTPFSLIPFSHFLHSVPLNSLLPIFLFNSLQNGHNHFWLN